ncbi:Splicing factor 3A subunit [Entamoeba marina]
MFGREHGSKPGSGGLATAAETSANRKERLRQLALEKMDLSKDPYFHKTHLGSFECPRELKEARDRGIPRTVLEINKPLVKCFMKIGTPGYSVVKQIDQLTNKKSIQFKLNYPDIAVGVIPLYRLMGAFEQRQEIPDRSYQYLVIAAEPYDTIAFKIPRLDIEKDPETGKHGKSIWDEKNKVFTLVIHYL